MLVVSWLCDQGVLVLWAVFCCGIQNQFWWKATPNWGRAGLILDFGQQAQVHVHSRVALVGWKLTRSFTYCRPPASITWQDCGSWKQQHSDSNRNLQHSYRGRWAPIAVSGMPESLLYPIEQVSERKPSLGWNVSTNESSHQVRHRARRKEIARPYFCWTQSSSCFVIKRGHLSCLVLA